MVTVREDIEQRIGLSEILLLSYYQFLAIKYRSRDIFPRSFTRRLDSKISAIKKL
jgi:hypothetical protein